MLGFKLDNPGAALANGTVILRVGNPDSGALLMKEASANVSVAASGQWSQTYRWTVPQGVPAHVLVIASLCTAGCEEAVATATLKIGNGGNGTGTGTETGNAKKVPVNGPAELLLLTAAVACLDMAIVIWIMLLGRAWFWVPGSYISKGNLENICSTWCN